MTAKPAPVIVDGVPMCSGYSCPLSKQNGLSMWCTVDNRAPFSRDYCLPAIREMHAELVQLRKRDPLAKCGVCGMTREEHYPPRGTVNGHCANFVEPKPAATRRKAASDGGEEAGEVEHRRAVVREARRVAEFLAQVVSERKVKRGK